MSFVLKVYKDATEDEPIQVLPVEIEEATQVHEYWRSLGYTVGLYPKVECGVGCPFRFSSVAS